MRKKKYVKNCAMCGNAIEKGGEVRLYIWDEESRDNCKLMTFDSYCALWFLTQRNLKEDSNARQ